VQDYQLLLLPAMLREARPEASIGFFLHIPFPSHELMRVLPWRNELLRGMLGADLIGFHTFGYMRHFLSSVAHALGLPAQNGRIETANRSVRVDAFPMGIDYERYAQAAASDEAKTARCCATRALSCLSTGSTILKVSRSGCGRLTCSCSATPSGAGR